jgi:hypothetical protein
MSFISEEGNHVPSRSEDEFKQTSDSQENTFDLNKGFNSSSSTKNQRYETESSSVSQLKRKNLKKHKHLRKDFYGDGYDQDFIGDSDDETYINSLKDYEREVVMNHRYQLRQERLKRASLKEDFEKSQQTNAAKFTGKVQAECQQTPSVKNSDLAELLKNRNDRKNLMDNQDHDGSEEGHCSPVKFIRKPASKKRKRHDSDEDDYIDIRDFVSRNSGDSGDGDAVNESRHPVVKKKKTTQESGRTNVSQSSTSFNRSNPQAAQNAQLQKVLSQERAISASDTELVSNICLKRKDLVKWNKYLHFHETVKDCLVMINYSNKNQGLETTQQKYYVVRIMDIVEKQDLYTVDQTKTNKWLLVDYLGTMKEFEICYVSNNNVDEYFLKNYIDDCIARGISLMTIRDVEAKVSQIRDHLLKKITDKEISAQVQKNVLGTDGNPSTKANLRPTQRKTLLQEKLNALEYKAFQDPECQANKLLKKEVLLQIQKIKKDIRVIDLEIKATSNFDMELLGSQYNASTNLLSFGTGRAKVRFSLVKKLGLQWER